MKKRHLSVAVLSFIIASLLCISFVSASSLQIVKNTTLHSGELARGVTYESFTATTTTDAGTVGEQRISYVKKEAASPIKVVSWSKLSGASIVGTNVITLAQDFEAKNPGYRVIAGINGDYYNPTDKVPINALVQQGDVIKYNNFNLPRYFSIAFNDNATGFVASKNNILEPYYVLSIYDSTNSRIEHEVPLAGINIRPGVNQTTIYYKSLQSVETSDASQFLIEFPSAYTNYGTIFIKGNVTRQVTSTVTTLHQATIVTNDQKVRESLIKNPLVRIQKNLSGDNAGFDNIIGVGSQPLKDGNILSFQDIGDQSVNFASARAPRSSVGFTDAGDLIIATIDGRQTNMSGADLREEAVVMQSLGCVDAFNLDGGGSTQLMIRENGQFKMLNSPSETYRNNSNGILFVVPDVFIDATFENLTTSSVDVSYQIHAEPSVDVKGLNIYVNDTLREFPGNFSTLTNLISGGINHISFEATYESQGVTHTRSFLSKRINIANFVEEVIPPKEKPSNFRVRFIDKPNWKGFEAIVNFDDPGNTFHRLYLTHNGIKAIAIKDARGYVCEYKNIENNTLFHFEIEYYYRISTINPVFETYEEIFSYQYNMEDSSNDIVEPPPIKDNTVFIVGVSTSVISLGVATFMFLIRRRKK